MTLVLLSNDLAVLSRVESAAARLGKKVRIVPNASQAVEGASSGQLELAIIDLSSPSLEVETTVNQLKSNVPSARIIAFGPHVHEAKLASAREAGCDLVVSRGQFFSQLDSILAENAH